MPFELRITDAGRAALADGANRGTHAIRLTKMALGSGSGPGGAADDSRTALRMARDTVALSGTSTVSGRIAVRGEFNPTEAYDVTEVGILGRVGVGAEELYAYWTDGGTKIAATLADTRLVIAGSLDIAPATAEVTVMISASISLGDPALSASVTSLGGRVGDLETQDETLAQADAALDTRVAVLETPDFAAQIEALTNRVQEAEESSVIRTIIRGQLTFATSALNWAEAETTITFPAITPSRASVQPITLLYHSSVFGGRTFKITLEALTSTTARWKFVVGDRLQNLIHRQTISYEIVEFV